MDSIDCGVPATILSSQDVVIFGVQESFALLTGLRRCTQKQTTSRGQIWEARGLRHGERAGSRFTGLQGVGAPGVTEKLPGKLCIPAGCAASAFELGGLFWAGAPPDGAPAARSPRRRRDHKPQAEKAT